MSLLDISRWLTIDPYRIDPRLMVYTICVIACIGVYLLWKR